MMCFTLFNMSFTLNITRSLTNCLLLQHYCKQVRVVRISKATYETVLGYLPSNGSHIGNTNKVKDAAIAVIAATNTFESVSSSSNSGSVHGNGSGADLALLTPSLDDQIVASPNSTDHLTDASSPQSSPVSNGIIINNISSSTQLIATDNNSSSGSIGSQQHHN
jgi:hypothetical protein